MMAAFASTLQGLMFLHLDRVGLHAWQLLCERHQVCSAQASKCFANLQYAVAQAQLRASSSP